MNRVIWTLILVMSVILLIVPFLFPETTEPLSHVAFAFAFYFLGAEHSSLSDGVPRNTMSEFIRWTITDRPARFLIGVLLSLTVYVRVDEFIGILLAIWLPLHLTFPGIEKKIFTFFKEKLT